MAKFQKTPFITGGKGPERSDLETHQSQRIETLQRPRVKGLVAGREHEIEHLVDKF